MTRFIAPLPSAAQDVALLVGRLLLGIVLIAHGWQKVHDYTLSGTAASFDKMGVPLPRVTATYAAVAELGGGVLLVLGLLTSIASLLVVLDMAGAWVLVHCGAGIFVEHGGGELVMMIGAAALVIGVLGAGGFSVDRTIAKQR